MSRQGFYGVISVEVRTPVCETGRVRFDFRHNTPNLRVFEKVFFNLARSYIGIMSACLAEKENSIFSWVANIK